MCVAVVSLFYSETFSCMLSMDLGIFAEPHKIFVSILLNSSLILCKWIILITTCLWLEPGLTQDSKQKYNLHISTLRLCLVTAGVREEKGERKLFSLVGLAQVFWRFMVKSSNGAFMLLFK